MTALTERSAAAGRLSAVLRSRAGAGPGLTLAAGALAWLATVPVLRAVLTDNDRGLDAMDESHYLMAAQPWASDKAFNGVFGWYGGLLLRLVGGDLARYRLLGDLVLIAAAVVLAAAVRSAAVRLAGVPWPGWLRAVWPPAVVSAALCYYTVFVRTPSYNWFAAVGLVLLAAGLLRTVASPPATRWGILGVAVLLSGGAFLAAVGKATTSAGATALAVAALVVHVLFAGREAGAQVVRAQVARVVAAAGGVAVLLVVLHLTLVNGAATTIETYRRVGGMLATVDPWHYAPDALWGSVLTGWHDVAVYRPQDYLWLLAVPLLLVAVPWLGARRPGWWLAAGLLAVAGIPLREVVTSYPGGVPGLAMSTPPVVIAADAGALTGAVVVVWARLRPARPEATATNGGAGVRGAATALMLCLALLGMGLCYPVGTNVEYATQLHGGFVVLLAAAALGVCCVPDGGRLACLAGLAAGAILLGSVLVPGTRQLAPYRIALLDQQTVPRSVVAGTPPILVDPVTARWVDDLRARAGAAGFVPGTPVLDLTWHPATVLVLGGRAPKTLLPAFPGWPTPAESARYTLEQEDPRVWRTAWIVVLAGREDAIADQATQVVGLRFPQDYQRVGVVTAPYDGQQQELWRPLPG